MTTEALTPYRANGNETAVTTYEAPSVGLAASLDDLVQNMKDYQSAVAALLNDSDYQGIGDKQFKKKSAWRKLGVAFGVTVSIVSRDVTYDDSGRIHHAEFVVRATARNGRYAEAWGGASVVDRDFSHDQDVAATAQTRATNRAISDLIGSGEVSAEEMSGGQGRSQAPRSAPALGKCPDGHPISDGKFGPQCKGKTPDGSWHNWRPPKQSQPAPDDAIPADFREVDEAPEDRGSGDDALKAAASKLKAKREVAPEALADDVTPMSALWTRVQMWAKDHGTDPQRLRFYLATPAGVPERVGQDAMRAWLGSAPENTLDRLYELYVAGESAQDGAETAAAAQGGLGL